MSDVTERIEEVMEKYAPSGYDPASDDMTIPFAIELVEKDAVIEQMAADYRVLGDKYLAHEAEIARLTDAIWEYGEHRKSCRIDSGKECDCGFFKIITTLKPE